MLLAVMLTVTVMLLALSIALPRITQQIKREKEEELIHRGKEYAMAIKRFYHSPASRGTYPTSLDQLDNTNNMRFLRKHFKDPMTVDGEWKLIHLGEAQIPMSNPGGVPRGMGSLATGPLSGAVTPSPSPSPSASPGTLGSGLGGNVGGAVQSPGGGLGSLQTTGSPLQAGGFIIGVASKSKETSIKEFNGTNQYDQWLFVFDPRAECALPAAAAPAAGIPAAGTPAAIPASPAPCAGNGITIAAAASPSSSPANPPVPGASVSPTPVQGISPPPVPGTSPTPAPGISPPAGPGTSPTPGTPTPPQH
jgi:type II secretory pathway pseudopilin PulG